MSADLCIPAPPLAPAVLFRPLQAGRSRAWALGAMVREASLMASAGAVLSWGVAEVAGALLGY